MITISEMIDLGVKFIQGEKKYTEEERVQIAGIKRVYTNMYKDIAVPPLPECFNFPEGDSIRTVPKDTIDKHFWIGQVKSPNGYYDKLKNALEKIVEYEHNRLYSLINREIDPKELYQPLYFFLFELKQWLIAAMIHPVNAVLKDDLIARQQYVKEICDAKVFKQQDANFAPLMMEIKKILGEVEQEVNIEVCAASAETNITYLTNMTQLLLIDTIDFFKIAHMPQEPSKIIFLLEKLNDYQNNKKSTLNDLRATNIFIEQKNELAKDLKDSNDGYFSGLIAGYSEKEKQDFIDKYIGFLIDFYEMVRFYKSFYLPLHCAKLGGKFALYLAAKQRLILHLTFFSDRLNETFKYIEELNKRCSAKYSIFRRFISCS